MPVTRDRASSAVPSWPAPPVSAGPRGIAVTAALTVESLPLVLLATAAGCAALWTASARLLRRPARGAARGAGSAP